MDTKTHEVTDIQGIVDEVLKPRPLKEGFCYFFCDGCGWHGCGSEILGCEPIGDTGDYSEPVCPDCHREMDDWENPEPLLAALYDRLRRRLAGEPWPVRSCDGCGVELVDQRSFYPRMTLCPVCWEEYEAEAKREEAAWLAGRGVVDSG